MPTAGSLQDRRPLVPRPPTESPGPLGSRCPIARRPAIRASFRAPEPRREHKDPRESPPRSRPAPAWTRAPRELTPALHTTVPTILHDIRQEGLEHTSEDA